MTTSLPRFTIRTLLIVLTVCACIAVVIGMALRGERWAWGISIALASMAVTAVVHGAWFVLVWFFARLLTIDSQRSQHQER